MGALQEVLPAADSDRSLYLHPTNGLKTPVSTNLDT